jgi:citrate synthase
MDPDALKGSRSEWLDSREAAALLDVKRETLYAYASRGLVRSVPAASGRGRRYARGDLERLRARHDARAGHGPVAASALRFGDPVLATRVSSIEPDGPRYRGHSAVELAQEDTGFEAAAELLWTGERPHRVDWSTEGASDLVERLARALPRDRPALPTLLAAAALLGLDDAAEPGFVATELSRARRLVRALVGALGLRHGKRRGVAAARGRTIAEGMAIAMGVDTARTVLAIDRVLVLTADHELNASTFAARVVASTGASLHACVAAALGAMTGPKHGTASDRVESILDEVRQPARARRALAARLARGTYVPGFGHPLYRQGDPRVPPLLDIAARVGNAKHLALPRAVARTLSEAGRDPPNLDFALVSVVRALGLPRGSGAALFAIGRTAGWIAHALEQRASGVLLRPRALYLDPAASPAS